MKNRALYINSTLTSIYPNLRFRGHIAEREYDKQFNKESEHDLGLGATLIMPVVFRHGQYFNKLTGSFGLTLHREEGTISVAHEYEASFVRVSKKSERDIYELWRQECSIMYSHRPYEGFIKKQSVTARALLRFPGLWKHHSSSLALKLLGKEELIKGSDTAISMFYCTPLELTYSLPLFYPDWGVNYLAYIKRVRADVVGTFGYYRGVAPGICPEAIGVNLIVDVNFFSFLKPLFAVGVGCYYSVINERFSHRWIFTLTP